MQDWVQDSGLYVQQLSIDLCYVTKSPLQGTLLVCEEVDCRAVAGVDIESMAAITAADQAEDWHLPNNEDEGDSQNFPSCCLPTELTRLLVPINKEHIKDVVAAEAVDPHPLAEEDGEVADQGHLDDGDLVGIPQLAPNVATCQRAP